MILTIAGIGPGDPELITTGALKAISDADLVLVPCSGKGGQSVADGILRAHLPELETVPFVFPMTHDAQERDKILREQINGLSGPARCAQSVVLPVIGDSALYSTGFYLFEVWRGLVPDIELRLIPGVSAHSLASARSGSFLAMGEEILTIIPGTAGREAIIKALRAADAAAIYKPSAIKDELRSMAELSGPWKRMVRVDRAGLPEEKILRGAEALTGAVEYLSLVLLWR